MFFHLPPWTDHFYKVLRSTLRHMLYKKEIKGVLSSGLNFIKCVIREVKVFHLPSWTDHFYKHMLERSHMLYKLTNGTAEVVYHSNVITCVELASLLPHSGME